MSSSQASSTLDLSQKPAQNKACRPGAATSQPRPPTGHHGVHEAGARAERLDQRRRELNSQGEPLPGCPHTKASPAAWCMHQVQSPSPRFPGPLQGQLQDLRGTTGLATMHAQPEPGLWGCLSPAQVGRAGVAPRGLVLRHVSGLRLTPTACLPELLSKVGSSHTSRHSPRKPPLGERST